MRAYSASSRNSRTIACASAAGSFGPLDEGELEAIRDRLRKEGVNPDAIEIGRFKGLGEMNPEQLRETTMDPATRRVLPVVLREGAEEETRKMFTLLMAKGESAGRRGWMEEKGNEVEADV